MRGARRTLEQRFRRYGRDHWKIEDLGETIRRLLRKHGTVTRIAGHFNVRRATVQYVMRMVGLRANEGICTRDVVESAARAAGFPDLDEFFLARFGDSFPSMAAELQKHVSGYTVRGRTLRKYYAPLIERAEG